MSARPYEAGGVNRHYLTLKSFAVDPRYLDDPGFRLGSGVDLGNPLHPLLAPFTAFEGVLRSSTTATAGLPESSEIIQEATTFKESLDQREEASILSTYFKASYGLSSVEAAYRTAREEKEEHHTIYALLTHTGETDSLPESSRKWRADEIPPSESVEDPDEALDLFVTRYGSHYVNTILYGLRIAVQGKLRRSSTHDSSEMSATFKAAFGSLGAEGGAQQQNREALEKMNVELTLEATSGGREGGGLLMARGLEDIAEFLDDLKNDRIRFDVAPLSLILKPYFPTLDPGWTLTREVLNPRTAGFTPPGAPYGVPKGTIVAWHPTGDFVKGLESEEDDGARTVVPPDGWAICDGTRGTPDLRARFIRGTASWSADTPTGGSESHDHGGATANNTQFRGAHGGAGGKYQQPAQKHTHPIGAASHLPPYADVIYIIKLADGA